MATLSFRVPDPKRIRLLIDTDAKNEADDQYAIVHALLTPRFINRGSSPPISARGERRRRWKKAMPKRSG